MRFLRTDPCSIGGFPQSTTNDRTPGVRRRGTELEGPKADCVDGRPSTTVDAQSGPGRAAPRGARRRRAPGRPARPRTAVRRGPARVETVSGCRRRHPCRSRNPDSALGTPRPGDGRLPRSTATRADASTGLRRRAAGFGRRVMRITDVRAPVGAPAGRPRRPSSPRPERTVDVTRAPGRRAGDRGRPGRRRGAAARRPVRAHAGRRGQARAGAGRRRAGGGGRPGRRPPPAGGGRAEGPASVRGAPPSGSRGRRSRRSGPPCPPPRRRPRSGGGRPCPHVGGRATPASGRRRAAPPFGGAAVARPGGRRRAPGRCARDPFRGAPRGAGTDARRRRTGPVSGTAARDGVHPWRRPPVGRPRARGPRPAGTRP